MTFIIAMKSKSGIVIASDMQATDGNDLKYKKDKIFKVGNHGIAAFSGDCWFAEKLLEMMEVEFSKEFQFGFNHFSAERLTAAISEKITETKKMIKKSQGRQDSFYGADIIIATMDNKGGQKLLTIYNKCIPEFKYESGFEMIGNASDAMHSFARAILEKQNYDALSILDMELIGYRMVSEASKWVSGVGEGIDIWSISKEDGIRRLGNSELSALEEQVRDWRALEVLSFELIRSRGHDNNVLKKLCRNGEIRQKDKR